jgi:hypothetical protein
MLGGDEFDVVLPKSDNSTDDIIDWHTPHTEYEYLRSP